MTVYAINDIEVTAPDEEVWTPIVQGESLTGRQKRSPWYRLEWRRTVGGPCELDWYDFDNLTLSSLSCRPPGILDDFVRITSPAPICQSVTLRHRLSVGTEIVATFLVYYMD